MNPAARVEELTREEAHIRRADLPDVNGYRAERLRQLTRERLELNQRRIAEEVERGAPDMEERLADLKGQIRRDWRTLGLI